MCLSLSRNKASSETETGMQASPEPEAQCSPAITTATVTQGNTQNTRRHTNARSAHVYMHGQKTMSWVLAGSIWKPYRCLIAKDYSGNHIPAWHHTSFTRCTSPAYQRPKNISVTKTRMDVGAALHLIKEKVTGLGLSTEWESAFYTCTHIEIPP